MRDHYYLGLFTGFGLGGLYFMITILLKPPPSGVVSPQKGVIDNYRGCNVIAWQGERPQPSGILS